jgi:hypothetical protein
MTDLRPRRAARVTGWTLVVLGLTHLVTVAGAALGGQDAATLRVTDQMRTVRVALPGLQPTMADLFTGYSLAMGLMVVTAGSLLLVVAGAPVATVRTGLAVSAVSSAIGLVVAWALLPSPPVLGLGVALVATVAGLVGKRP